MCAFTVAWGVMATKFARLLGLIILLVTTHRAKALLRWELIAVVFWLLVSFVLILVDGALNTGTIKVAQYLDLSFCVRKFVLPTSILSSLVYIFLELYFIARLSKNLLSLMPPEKTARVWTLLRDSPLQRASSLLFFELLAIVPSASEMSTVAVFIPMTIGSVAVLIAFSSHSQPDHESSVRKRSEDQKSFSFTEKLPPSPIRMRAFDYPPTIDVTSAITHPYSAASLSNRDVVEVDGPIPATSKSNMTFESSHTYRARSVPLGSHHPASLQAGRSTTSEPSQQERSPTTPRQRSIRSVFSLKGRPKLTVITRGLPKYKVKKLPLPQIHSRNTEKAPQSAVDTIYSFYTNTPRSEMANNSRFSSPSTERSVELSPSLASSAGASTPRGGTTLPTITEGASIAVSVPNPAGTVAGVQSRNVPQTPGLNSRPKGPRTQLSSTPKPDE
ncbi:hypothetical protein V5O48_007429 [Marasmius crinis-equi]|uniref:Pheromone receptor n=1 Tax=Marasmius crinis-equi TaxID=585013 RepID=A0ABR3FGP9_9AGAR